MANVTLLQGIPRSSFIISPLKRTDFFKLINKNQSSIFLSFLFSLESFLRPHKEFEKFIKKPNIFRQSFELDLIRRQNLENEKKNQKNFFKEKNVGSNSKKSETKNIFLELKKIQEGRFLEKNLLKTWLERKNDKIFRKKITEKISPKNCLKRLVHFFPSIRL